MTQLSGAHAFRLFLRQLSTDFHDERSKLQWYSKFKNNINLVDYLHEINNFKYRQTVAKFRISAHCFEIERVRYCRPFSEGKWCKCCSQNVCDDECHFLISCDFLNNERS